MYRLHVAIVATFSTMGGGAAISISTQVLDFPDPGEAILAEKALQKRYGAPGARYQAICTRLWE